MRENQEDIERFGQQKIMKTIKWVNGLQTCGTMRNSMNGLDAREYRERVKMKKCEEALRKLINRMRKMRHGFNVFHQLRTPENRQTFWPLDLEQRSHEEPTWTRPRESTRMDWCSFWLTLIIAMRFHIMCHNKGLGWHGKLLSETTVVFQSKCSQNPAAIDFVCCLLFPIAISLHS